MALVIRTITNAGNQLFSPSGVLLAGVTITLDLVNQSGAPVDVWDAKSKEHVGPIRESVITDNYGEFTIAVWPNSRGNIITKYLCRVHSPGFKPFFAALPEADLSPIKWVDFMANSQPLTAAEMNPMNSHLNDFDMHFLVKEADSPEAEATAFAAGARIVIRTDLI